MNKTLATTFLSSLLLVSACGKDEPKGPSNSNGNGNNTEQTENNGTVKLPDGKKIYIPNELKNMDFQKKESQWSYHRMACTDNFVIFWEKGFGDDLAKAPKLNGQDMTVNLDNLKERLEYFYKYYYDNLGFVEPGKSTCDKYRMMIMLQYSLDGTAYGGGYDNVIGALWVAPNRIQDQKLNCIAHELGHCFQFQIWNDNRGEAWGGSPFFEMTSQWMLWQVNKNWISDESYHWDSFKNKTHKAFIHTDNIYSSPYVLEYWSQKHGLDCIGKLFCAGKNTEDPVDTYKKLYGLTQDQFCDEMFDASCHIVNLDFDRVWNDTRKYANTSYTRLSTSGEWLAPTTAIIPENYGFNTVRLNVPEAGTEVSVEFEGDDSKVSSGIRQYAGWRYGFMGVDKEGKSVYGEMASEKTGTVSFTIPEGGLNNLYLVVMGAPTRHFRNPNDGSALQWPYRVKISGTTQK